MIHASSAHLAETKLTFAHQAVDIHWLLSGQITREAIPVGLGCTGSLRYAAQTQADRVYDVICELGSVLAQLTDTVHADVWAPLILSFFTSSLAARFGPVAIPALQHADVE